jgi:hypothetical protein
MKMKYGRMSFGKKATRITIVHLNKPQSCGLAGMVTSPIFAENIALVSIVPLRRIWIMTSLV